MLPSTAATWKAHNVNTTLPNLSKGTGRISSLTPMPLLSHHTGGELPSSFVLELCLCGLSSVCAGCQSCLATCSMLLLIEV